MNNNLLILGAGQYGSVIKEIAEEMKVFDKIDFLDDTYGKGEFEGDYHEQSIGKLKDYEKFPVDYSYAIISIENAQLRKEWTEKIEEIGYRIPVIVSSKAYISKSAQVQKGCVIEPLACIHANAVLSAGSFVSAGAVVNHNSFVGDFCHIDNNAVIMSGALVPPCYKTKPCEVFCKKTINQDDISKRTPIGNGYRFEDGV